MKVDAYSYAKGKIHSTFNVLSDTFTRGAFSRLEELEKKEVGITPTPLARVCNPCVAIAKNYWNTDGTDEHRLMHLTLNS